MRVRCILSLLLLFFAVPTAVTAQSFIRGDLGGNGSVDLGDAILSLEHLFLGKDLDCLDGADFNDDGQLTLLDPIEKLSFLFLSTSPPAGPYPNCGVDPTLDAIDCRLALQCGLETVSIESDKLMTAPGTMFLLAVRPVVPNRTYTWAFDDGTTLQGAQVSKSFAQPGTYGVEVESRDLAGDLRATGLATLAVISDGFGFDFSGAPFPNVPGDVDGDGELTLSDVQQMRQALTRLVPLDLGQPELGDFDFDGSLTETDAELAAQALLSSEGWPSQVVPQSSLPGATVTVFAPDLLETDVDIQFRFSGHRPIRPPRIILGQVQLFVPIDVLSPGAFTTVSGSTSLQVIVDGVVTRTLPLEIEAPPPLPPGGPMAALTQLVDEAAPIRDEILTSLMSLTSAPMIGSLGYTATDLEAMAIALEAIYAEMAALEQELLADLTALPSDQQELAYRLAIAAGVGDPLPAVSTAGLPPSALLGSPTLSSATVFTFCTLEVAAANADVLARRFGYLCSGLTVLAGVCIATPFDGPVCDIAALLAAAAKCATYFGYLEAAKLILELTPKVGSQLQLTVDTDTMQDPVVSTIIVEVPLSARVCQLGINQGFIDKYQKSLASRLLQTGPLFPIYRTARALSNQTATTVRNLVSQAIGSVFAATNFSMLIETVVNGVCQVGGAVTGTPLIRVNTNDVTPQLTPNVGVLTPQSDGTFTYTCPTPDPQNPIPEVQLSLSFPNCQSAVVGAATLPCAAPVELSISIGDNGAATDDIFEAAIDGTTVLTMGAPTTAVSTVVTLAPGTYSLRMRGLAAPDMIGTYFVSISGGSSTLSGPGGCGASCTFASGTDLNAGTTFFWTLTVAN